MAKQKSFMERMDESDFAGHFSAREAAQKDTTLVESLTGFINLLNDKHLGKYAFGHRMEEAATTSDFPNLLGLVLDQQLLAQYKLIPADWRDYVATGLQTDFRQSQMNKLWGLEKPLPQVAQMAEYPEVTVQEGKVLMSLKKYGKVFGLTWEDLINDRLGAFSDAASLLSRAAFKTEYRFATGLFATPTGPSAALFGTPVVHPLDGAQVTNKLTLPLTAANLATAISIIRKQVDADGEPIFFERVHVIVAPANELNLKSILSPANIMKSGGDTSAGTKGVIYSVGNVLNNYTIIPHVNPYLPIIDQTANNNGTWYVVVDKADAQAVQMNFLRNHETPEVFMKESNQTSTSGGAVGAMEGSFEDDTIWWKIRHVFGGVTIDPRAALVSVSATAGQ